MISSAKSLCGFLDACQSVALVEVSAAKGSTPREQGVWMLVSPDRIFGTIGGGQLEYMAIDKAREMLGAALDGCLNAPAALLDIPLGPEIGQCCGGRVQVAITPVDAKIRERLLNKAAAEDAARPHVYIFGGGHVGHALADALALLPVRIIVIETRADELTNLPAGIETRLTAVPEEAVLAAPAGSVFLILTHDHALDFLIVAEALKREGAAYVGMIGSKTKKATFKSWYLKTAGGAESTFSRLVCPIGGDAVKDKRPAVIAAMAVAEVLTALASSGAAMQCVAARAPFV